MSLLDPVQGMAVMQSDAEILEKPAVFLPFSSVDVGVECSANCAMSFLRITHCGITKQGRMSCPPPPHLDPEARSPIQASSPVPSSPPPPKPRSPPHPSTRGCIEHEHCFLCFQQS